MLDPDKIAQAVRAFGWPKAMYFACLALLFRHIVTFEQCLILLFVAVGLSFLPRELKMHHRKLPGGNEIKRNRSIRKTTAPSLNSLEKN